MHLVQTMAYAGETPWHCLGNKLGMDWRIEESEVRYVSGRNGLGVVNSFPEQKVLYRSDTMAPLSVVSKRYQVHHGDAAP